MKPYFEKLNPCKAACDSLDYIAPYRKKSSMTRIFYPKKLPSPQ